MHLKVVILFILAFIVISLGLSFYWTIRDNGQTNRTIRTLTWSLLFCAGMLILLLVGISLGWITPHEYH